MKEIAIPATHLFQTLLEPFAQDSNLPYHLKLGWSLDLQIH
jgi:hypothetical protein